jgi:hypothetical protein
MQQLQLASSDANDQKADWPITFDTSTTDGSLPTPVNRKYDRVPRDCEADDGESQGTPKKYFECQS